MYTVFRTSQYNILRWKLRELRHDLLCPHSHKMRRYRRNKKNIRNLHQPADPTLCLLRGNLPAVQLGIVIKFFDHRSSSLIGPGSDLFQAIRLLRMIFFICHTDGYAVKWGGDIVPVNTDTRSEHTVLPHFIQIHSTIICDLYSA